jgi:precorrin-6A/cobalt-precorrin-6A reductase
VILLLGGTSESAPLALSLAEAGHSVLVSMATDVPFDIVAHPRVRRRSGPLDEEGMAALVGDQAIGFIVDATHPFAAVAKRTARSVATRLRIPYLALTRPPGITAGESVLRVPDHDVGARMAFEFGQPVLLTIGSKNLEPYAKEARKRHLPLVARVLDHPASMAACHRAGLGEDCLILGRGPFSFEQNREAIQRFRIGVLVTKDSGRAGGFEAKVQAAAAESCRVVVVDRPTVAAAPSVTSIAEVVCAVKATLRAPETGWRPAASVSSGWRV